MTRISKLLLVLSAWAATQPAPTTGPRDDPSASAIEGKLDAYLAPYVAAHDFSGAVLIADGDRILARKAYGMADYALNAPNSPATKFGIASITKSFTAAGVIMLQERGKLRFEDRLTKFIPDYPAGDKISVRLLLAHMAGIPNSDDVFGKELTPDDLINTFKYKPLEFEPGTRDRYSNSGYVLLARIIEKVSGQRFEDFLRDNIFTPLGMANTGSLHQTRIIHNLASRYMPGPGPFGLENAITESPSSLFGSGCLYSTVDDLYRWGQAVRSDQLFKRTALRYPYGWGARNQYGHRYIEQSGHVNGFMAHLIVFLDRPVCVVFLSNIKSGLFSRFEKDVTTIVFGGERTSTPPAARPVTLNWKHLSGFVGRYRGPGFTLRIFEADGNLYSAFNNDQSRSFLAPTGNDELFMRSDYARILGTRDQTGQVTELSIFWGDAPGPMKMPRG